MKIINNRQDVEGLEWEAKLLEKKKKKKKDQHRPGKLNKQKADQRPSPSFYLSPALYSLFMK
jgi:hypothetical protein